MNGRTLVVRGDALRLPLPDASVDLIVTSPPYWALRDYQTPGQLGSEPTPQEFLTNLWAATREMVRVLKPTGSIFVDLGDCYSSKTKGSGGTGKSTLSRHTDQGRLQSQLRSQSPVHRIEPGVPEKSLMLLPERYRVGCVDQLGLIARAVIVWDKPNGLPESVRDRVRRSHEDWVHLVKQPRYYHAIDEVREPQAEAWRSTGKVENRGTKSLDGGANNGFGLSGETPREYNPLGKLPGSVWSVPSEPLRLPAWLGVDHYAAFPSEWPRRFILGWSPPGICLDCGTGRFPVVDRQAKPLRGNSVIGGRKGTDESNGWGGFPVLGNEATILGYACGCTPHTDHPERRGTSHHSHSKDDEAGRNQDGAARKANYLAELENPRGPVREYHLDDWQAPPTRPALVCDPFGGTGTTAMVARALGRDAITVDLSHGYCRAARWRVFQSGNAGKALARTNLERQVTLL